MTLALTVSSFGYKFGAMPDADWVVDSRMLRSAKPRHRSRGRTAVDGTGGRTWNPDGRGASGLLLRRQGRRRYGQRVRGRRRGSGQTDVGPNRGRAQWPVGGISAGLSACLAFFAARFSFRVLPGFFTLLFCGDLLDTTVLPHNIRMVRSEMVGPSGYTSRGPASSVTQSRRGQTAT